MALRGSENFQELPSIRIKLASESTRGDSFDLFLGPVNSELNMRPVITSKSPHLEANVGLHLASRAWEVPTQDRTVWPEASAATGRWDIRDDRGRGAV